MQSDLPKGMLPPIGEHTGAPVHQPVPRHLVGLADGNYVGAIYAALAVLPVEVRVDRCLVVERHGQAPQLRLQLTILGEKGRDEHGT